MEIVTLYLVPCSSKKNFNRKIALTFFILIGLCSSLEVFQNVDVPTFCATQIAKICFCSPPRWWCCGGSLKKSVTSCMWFVTWYPQYFMTRPRGSNYLIMHNWIGIFHKRSTQVFSDESRTKYFAWEELPKELFNNLFDARPKIIQKIIEAKGGQTKY